MENALWQKRSELNDEFDNTPTLDFLNDEDGSEIISVWDAADIWRSHGKDEDYMFG